MHKYKLERQLLAKGAQQIGQGWVTADGDVDHEAHSVVDANATVRGPFGRASSPAAAVSEQGTFAACLVGQPSTYSSMQCWPVIATALLAMPAGWPIPLQDDCLECSLLEPICHQRALLHCPGPPALC